MPPTTHSPMPQPLTATELAAARARLGRTPDQMAADLGLTPNVYEAMEAGALAVPKRTAQWVRIQLDALDREAALATSGLPECPWVKAFEARPEPRKIEERTRRHEELIAHVQSCATCQARNRFLDERFGPPPMPPLPGWVRAVGRVGDFAGRLPAWARPAVWGAAALALLTLLRVVFVLPAAVRTPRVLVTGLLAVVAASAAGALGGLTYGIVGRPLQRVRVVGPYLAGMVAVAGYLVPLLLLLDPDFRRGDGLGIALVLVVLFGAVVGHMLFRRSAAAADSTGAAAS